MWVLVSNTDRDHFLGFTPELNGRGLDYGQVEGLVDPSVRVPDWSSACQLKNGGVC